MPRCIKIRRKKRSLCLGDLNKEIILQNRSIVAPLFGKTDFDENFSDTSTAWAMVETVDGKSFFDGVGAETNITHNFYIRYDVTVTSETWVQFESRRFDILKPEDYEERHDFMKLVCVERGPINLNATKV